MREGIKVWDHITNSSTRDNGISLCSQHFNSVQAQTKAEGEMTREMLSTFTADTYVYLIYNPVTSLIKIGKSKDPERRMSALEHASGVRLQLLKVWPETYDMNEAALHLRFQQHRKLGEWFEVSDELIDLAGGLIRD